MCNPALAIPLAGMALSGAGSFMQAREGNANQARMMSAGNAATEANFRRQDALAAEARQKFNDTVPKVGADATQQSMAKAADNRTAAGEAAIGNPGSYSAPAASSSEPQVVQSEIARKIGEALASGRTQAANYARLKSYGDASMGNSFTTGRAAGEIGDVGSFARGVAALLPLERDAAMRNAYKAPGFLPQALQIGGQGLSMWGMMGAPGLGGGGGPPGMYNGGTGTGPYGFRIGGV